MTKRYPLIILIILIATATRLHALDTQSFWNDEGNSARIAERPLSAIVEGAAGDIHPPGYYLLLAGWRAGGGQSEFSLRLFSAFAGILTVAVVAAIGRQFFDRRVGVLAALLVALNPFHIYYGQEARMYALLALLVAMSIWLTGAVLTIPNAMRTSRQAGTPFDGRRAGLIIAGYILINTLGLYTHYSFPFVLLAESIVFIIWLMRREKKKHGLITWVILQGVPLLLYLLWLPNMIRQILNWPSGGEAPVDLLTFGRTLVYGVTLHPDAARPALIPLLILMVIGLFPPINPEKDRRYLNFSERLGLIGFWLLIPILLLSLAGVMTGSFLKFLLPANIALLILVARGIIIGLDLTRSESGRFKDRVIRLIIALIIGLGLLPFISGLQGLYTDPQYARDDYRGIAEMIQSQSGQDAVVILNAPNQWEVFTYYYPDGENVFPLPDANTEKTLDSLLTDYKRVYALYWGVDQQDPNRIIEGRLEQRTFITEDTWYGGVRLVTYAVIGEPATEIAVPFPLRFGDGDIRLEGYTLSTKTLAPGDALGLTLFWSTNAPITERYKVFVHLIGPDGLPITQHDSEPGNGLLPTDGWISGETIIDPHGLLLPADTPPGTYQLIIGMYIGDQRLIISQAEEAFGDNMLITEIIVGD